MSGAAEVLKKANLNLEQRIQVQTSLAAQLRNLVAGHESDAKPAGKSNHIYTLLGGKQ